MIQRDWQNNKKAKDPKSLSNRALLSEAREFATFSLPIKENKCVQPSSFPFLEGRWGHGHLHLFSEG